MVGEGGRIFGVAVTVGLLFGRHGRFARLGSGFFHPAAQKLIDDNAQQNDRSDHHQVERTLDAEQIHEVLQDLDQGGSENDAEDRSFSAAEAATAEDRRGDAV